MEFQVLVDEVTRRLSVAPDVLAEGGEFFARMDHDMDRGWQMGQYWIEQPDRVQRCQIAADRLLTALETGNETLALLMAGYILTRLDGVRGVRIDSAGELLETEFF